jgi:PPE-repeat protein
MNASDSARKKSQEPDAAAAAASASNRERTRARRRRRAELRGYGDEFMNMDIAVKPDWEPPDASTAASDQGAGPLGFAGTTRQGSATVAAGLNTLPDSAFGDGARMPMLPNTWEEKEER